MIKIVREKAEEFSKMIFFTNNNSRLGSNNLKKSKDKNSLISKEHVSVANRHSAYHQTRIKKFNRRFLTYFALNASR